MRPDPETTFPVGRVVSLDTFHVPLTHRVASSAWSRMDAPLLDVAPSKPIEAIQADSRYAAENGQTTRSAEWKVPFILERFKTPRRGHIPKGT